MSTQLQFIGTEYSWFETAITGKSRGWRAGVVQEVSDGEATLLLGTGKFRRSGAIPLGNPDSLTAAQVATVQAISEAYSQQPTAWYAGEINSVVTPSTTADGDLATATDQVPAEWRIVADPDDHVVAAGALMSATNLWATVTPGGIMVQKPVTDSAGARKVFTAAYAVCVSNSAVPANYTGGAGIVNAADTNISNWIANMVQFQWPAGYALTDLRCSASHVFNTHYTALTVAAGKLA